MQRPFPPVTCAYRWRSQRSTRSRSSRLSRSASRRRRWPSTACCCYRWTCSSQWSLRAGATTGHCKRRGRKTSSRRLPGQFGSKAAGRRPGGGHRRWRAKPLRLRVLEAASCQTSTGTANDSNFASPYTTARRRTNRRQFDIPSSAERSAAQAPCLWAGDQQREGN